MSQWEWNGAERQWGPHRCNVVQRKAARTRSMMAWSSFLKAGSSSLPLHALSMWYWSWSRILSRTASSWAVLSNAMGWTSLVAVLIVLCYAMLCYVTVAE